MNTDAKLTRTKPLTAEWSVGPLTPNNASLHLVAPAFEGDFATVEFLDSKGENRPSAFQYLDDYELELFASAVAELNEQVNG